MIYSTLAQCDLYALKKGIKNNAGTQLLCTKCDCDKKEGSDEHATSMGSIIHVTLVAIYI